MDGSSKLPPILEEKKNKEDIENGVYDKDKCKVELRAILRSV